VLPDIARKVSAKTRMPFIEKASIRSFSSNGSFKAEREFYRVVGYAGI
jgi:hypothetical protein